jgi:carboxylate-amine ligase
MGVEEELLLVDASSAVPVPASISVIAAAALEQLDCAFVPEMHQEMLELVGTPHRSLAALGAQVARSRAAADRIARSVGARAVPLAISPLRSGPPHPSPGTRYQKLADRYGITPLQCMTCGLHVHVSITSPAEGVAVLDRIRAWLPALRALAANSPFVENRDTGYDSYRFELWNLWPSSGPTEVFGDLAAYRGATAELLATGALLDEGMLYSDARLSVRFPTVEVRVCDVPLTAELTAILAGLIRGLVSAAAASAARGEEPPALSANALRLASWDASLRGLSGTLLHPLTGHTAPAADVVRALLRYAEPGLAAHGDLAAVWDGVERVLTTGNGAAWQRHTAASTGLRTMVLAAADLGAAGPGGSTLPAMSGSG